MKIINKYWLPDMDKFYQIYSDWNSTDKENVLTKNGIFAEYVEGDVIEYKPENKKTKPKTKKIKYFGRYLNKEERALFENGDL